MDTRFFLHACFLHNNGTLHKLQQGFQTFFVQQCSNHPDSCHRFCRIQQSRVLRIRSHWWGCSGICIPLPRCQGLHLTTFGTGWLIGRPCPSTFRPRWNSARRPARWFPPFSIRADQRCRHIVRHSGCHGYRNVSNKLPLCWQSPWSKDSFAKKSVETFHDLKKNYQKVCFWGFTLYLCHI